MDKLLKGMPSIGCYIDDVIIAGKDVDACQQFLEQALKHLNDSSLTLKLERCKFFKDTLTYLGNKVIGDGIYRTDDKVKAVKEAHAPTCVTELKAFSEMLNFYS